MDKQNWPREESTSVADRTPLDLPLYLGMWLPSIAMQYIYMACELLFPRYSYTRTVFTILESPPEPNKLVSRHNMDCAFTMDAAKCHKYLFTLPLSLESNPLRRFPFALLSFCVFLCYKELFKMRLFHSLSLGISITSLLERFTLLVPLLMSFMT